MTASPVVALAPRQNQLVFRAVLDALSRPGEVTRLPETPFPAVLLPVLALSGLETPVHVARSEWADPVRAVTGAPLVERERAALAALDEPDLSGLPVGSAAAPERGALVALAADGFDDGPALRLSGPGVDGSREVRIAGLPADFAERRRAAADFPAGRDLLLVTRSGAVLGLPRSTRIEGGA
ncbi:phosphonate C-P lyase system protein PhnH [Saccharopolyspora sp. CA-218241]|uniref:phosphonate C-P lyase system protein PhnH n=1 Tax=Saccharopolyspora sp. CA-218241 TaxID=3240027 RepID=UPI003D993312